MSGEAKDQAIKLFGKTIPLADVPKGVGNGKGEKGEVVGKVGEGEDEEHEQEVFEDDDDDDDEVRETSSDAKASSSAKREDESRLVTSKEASSSDTTAGVISKTDEEQSTSNPHEKVLKKPDKILPCPRCNSMDTKFCYYNNYNVNQPRHFCKSCQRYWTAGGTMRNVPVGAGRRKSKSASPASNCRHITVPEGLQIPNGFHHPLQPKTNGTVLTFGSADSRLCGSMASVLNIGEKSLRNCTQNGFRKPEELIIPVACRNGENGAEIVNAGARAGDLQLNHKREKAVSKDCTLQNPLEIPPQMPCFPGTPWPYPVSPPALVPQVIPIPFYPAAAYWSIPWIPQPPLLPPTGATSSPNSSSLGKHSRDENMGKPENSGKEESSTEDSAEKCFWIPKTLRIDDPRESAKSSIWTTLGIKNDKADTVRGPLKAFQPTIEARSLVAKTSAFLQANPAALSRSLNFHESA